MQNIVYNGNTYKRIFIKDENTLIKISSLDIKDWKYLKEKSLVFLNTPTKIARLNPKEKKYFPTANSKIALPYLNNYQTLYNFQNQLDLKQVLLLFRRILNLTKEMHQNNIIHSDLYASNIMVNNSLDISFIDFDQSIINNKVSIDNVYYEEDIALDKKKNLAIIDDKLDVFSILFYYLIYGNYQKDINFNLDVKDLVLPNILQRELVSYLNRKQEIKRDYYFEDIIDELVSLDEIPSKKKKLSSFNN